MKKFYIVKDQYGNILAKTTYFCSHIQKSSLLAMSAAKAKCTFLLKRFDHYGIIPKIVEVTVTESPTPDFEFKMVCPRCQSDVEPVAHQVPNSNASINRWNPNIFISLCPVCKHKLEIKK